MMLRHREPALLRVVDCDASAACGIIDGLGLGLFCAGDCDHFGAGRDGASCGGAEG